MCLCLHLLLSSCPEAVYEILNARDEPVVPSYLDCTYLAALNETACSMGLYSGQTLKGDIIGPIRIAIGTTGVARPMLEPYHRLGCPSAR